MLDVQLTFDYLQGSVIRASQHTHVVVMLIVVLMHFAVSTNSS